MTLITYLTRVHFADNVLEHALRAELEALESTRPLLLTDRRTVASDLAGRLLGALPRGTVAEVFDTVPGRPDEAVAEAAVTRYRDGACDGVIGLGAGPVIDVAKVVRVLAGHGEPASAFAVEEGGSRRIRADRLPPMIAVPTTAGSGAEVRPDATILSRDGQRLVLVSPHLIPTSAICDPTLTLSMPPALTAETGMDALTHCVETYIARSYNPPADGIALDGVVRVAGNLCRAVERGNDLTARREMMAAALNGALALQKGLGATHAISTALADLHDAGLRHGRLSAVMLPHVLEFNAPAVGERLDALGTALSAPGGSVARAVAMLARRIALPAALGEMGLTEADVEPAAARAERDRNTSTNPRRARARDYADLMRAAL